MKIKSSVRQTVYRRDGFKCLKCLTKNDLSIDHVIPVSEGGKGSIDNLQTLCKRCNGQKDISTIDYREVKLFKTVIRKSKEEKPKPVSIANKISRRGLEIDSMRILHGNPGDTLILDFVYRKKTNLYPIDELVEAFNKAETRQV